MQNFRSALRKLSLLKSTQAQKQFERSAYNTAKRVEANLFDPVGLSEPMGRRATLVSSKQAAPFLGQRKSKPLAPRNMQEEASSSATEASTTPQAKGEQAEALNRHRPPNYYVDDSKPIKEVDRREWQQMFF